MYNNSISCFSVLWSCFLLLNSWVPEQDTARPVRVLFNFTCASNQEILKNSEFCVNFVYICVYVYIYLFLCYCLMCKHQSIENITHCNFSSLVASIYVMSYLTNLLSFKSLDTFILIFVSFL